jgi:hypothetical protein
MISNPRTASSSALGSLAMARVAREDEDVTFTHASRRGGWCRGRGTVARSRLTRPGPRVASGASRLEPHARSTVGTYRLDPSAGGDVRVALDVLTVAAARIGAVSALIALVLVPPYAPADHLPS